MPWYSGASDWTSALDYLSVAKVPEDYEERLTKERYEKELRWQLGNLQWEDLTLQLWMEMIEEDRTGSSRQNKP